MKRFRSVCLMVIVGLVVVGVVSHAPRALGAQYTARALIEVLPYPDKDPFSVETPSFDRDIQHDFRLSVAYLMTMQSNIEPLLRRDAVMKTQWYRNGQRDTRDRVRALRTNLCVVAQEKGNYLEVSMTCEDPQDAADIVNEAVTMFTSVQGGTARQRINERLVEVQEQRDSTQADLQMAERALDEVRKACGFTDLEERGYPHPVAARLIRLESMKDELALEIKGVEATIVGLEKRDKPSEPEKDALAVLQAKYAELERLRQEAQAKKRDLDHARVAYRQRVAIRDERLKMLDEIKMLIEKLRLLHDDPETPKLRAVGQAPRPLFPD